MSALPEAKQFVELHARHMGLCPERIGSVLRRIKTLNGDSPRAWVTIFTAEALTSEAEGKSVEAANLYNLARFPVADSATKREAASAAAQVFGEHIERTGTGERRMAQVGERNIPFLFRPGRSRRARLVILMGGIVSLKEQWGAFLKLGRKLGCAVAVADFAGVGSNALPYSRDAGRVFGAIMDEVAKECDSSETLIIAPSFGGHLAMLHSLIDPRINRIFTIGAPIQAFFDAASRPGENDALEIPLITRLALANSMRISVEDLPEKVGALAMSPAEIKRLSVPIVYVAAKHDEIIPSDEWEHVARRAPNLRVHEFDDVHGAPNHLKATRLMVLSVLLRHAGQAWLGRLVQSVLRTRFDVNPLPFK